MRPFELINLLQSFDNECDVDGSTPDDIHGRYDFTMPKVSNRNLPIMLYKREILDAVDENSAIVIHGATGSGKTTQVSWKSSSFSVRFPNECHS